MSNNQVVVYSNGIADFRRRYQLATGTSKKISIPVRQEHLADVLASFNIYGQVRLDSPPTFRPSNELDGNIVINSKRVLEELAISLSGSRVLLETPSGELEGTLVGLHQEEEATSGELIRPKSLIVLAEEGLRRCVLRDVQNFKFLDDDVQSEINKALQRNYQKIKPNSTFVELELSAIGEEAEAVVQYTIPAAAWKISYRLRMSEDGKSELQGYAIVDNNTDEDWNEFQVSVVTGEPITFSTDLSDSKTPRRKHVDLVSGAALGAVEVIDGLGAGAEMERSVQSASRGGGDAMMLAAAAPTARMRKGIPRSLPVAESESADVQEVGDFSIFESQSPVTIPLKIQQ